MGPDLGTIRGFKELWSGVAKLVMILEAVEKGK
jgi:hypothetical protein